MFVIAVPRSHRGDRLPVVLGWPLVLFRTSCSEFIMMICSIVRGRARSAMMTRLRSAGERLFLEDGAFP
jgi:hypothetical protein